MNRRHETPIKRVNPSGRVRWVARYTNREGKTKSAGTFDLRREAQDAIDAAYRRDAQGVAARSPHTVGAYAETWLDERPRARRTNVSYTYRLGCVLDVWLDGRPLREWTLADVRRRQVKELIGELLAIQGRSRTGALGVLWVLSAMWRDAMDDELVESNPFERAQIKASDPRIRKAPVAVRVFSWEQMHAFARAAGAVRTARQGPGELDRWRAAYAEAMVRVLSDCGLRLGELLALHREDLRGDTLAVRRTAWHGRIQAGTKTDHGEANPGRVVPVPPELAGMLAGMPQRIGRGSHLLFAGVQGGTWQESLFYRDLWRPAQQASGLDVRPHEMRHAYVSHLRAAGVDWADLAVTSGHSVQTAARYTHALHKSADVIRRNVG